MGGGLPKSSDCGKFATPCSRLLPRNAGGIVCCMPLSRTQPMPDLFGAVADHEPQHGPARPTSITPTPAVMSTADKSSPRYVLPKDLSNALQQLDDLELDRLVAASRHEQQRRGRPMISAPEIRPTTHISPGELTSKPSIAKDSRSERQQLPEPKGTLKQRSGECGARSLRGRNRAFSHCETIRTLSVRCAKSVGRTISKIWKRQIISSPGDEPI